MGLNSLRDRLGLSEAIDLLNELFNMSLPSSDKWNPIMNFSSVGHRLKSSEQKFH